MALVFLNQCGPSAEQTQTMSKTQHVQRHDNCLATTTVVANLVRAAKKESRPRRGTRRVLTLAQLAANSSATHSPSPEYLCALCGANDHWQPDCPSNVRSGGACQPVATVSVERIVSFVQNNSITLSDSLILLDSCSMCFVFKSPHLLRNVAHYSTKGHSSGITIVSNGGSMECSQVGKLPGLSFPVWYHPDSIANIVSLAEMVRERQITMDSDVKNALLLHAHDGQIQRFVACGGGLYTHDLSNKDHCVEPILTLTQTVAHLESQFAKRELKQAQAARDLQRCLSYPSQHILEHLLKSNYYPNCPVTAADVCRGITIYGPLPKLLQG